MIVFYSRVSPEWKTLSLMRTLPLYHQAQVLNPLVYRCNCIDCLIHLKEKPNFNHTQHILSRISNSDAHRVSFSACTEEG